MSDLRERVKAWMIERGIDKMTPQQLREQAEEALEKLSQIPIRNRAIESPLIGNDLKNFVDSGSYDVENFEEVEIMLYWLETTGVEYGVKRVINSATGERTWMIWYIWQFYRNDLIAVLVNRGELNT